jgi:hypothetical protein
VLRRAPLLATTDPAAVLNNRCVAFALTKQWDAAHTECNRAVREAQQERALSPSYQYWARKSKTETLVVALSNRAVLHWLTSESDAAASDLKRAGSLSPTADFVVNNLAALEHSRTAVAQVGVANTGH